MYINRWSKHDEDVIVVHYLYEDGYSKSILRIGEELLERYTGYIVIRYGLRNGRSNIVKLWVDDFTGVTTTLGKRLSTKKFLRKVKSDLNSDRSDNDITAKLRQVNYLYDNPSVSIRHILSKEKNLILSSLQDYDDAKDDPSIDFLIDPEINLPIEYLPKDYTTLLNKRKNKSKNRSTSKEKSVDVRVKQAEFRRRLIKREGGYWLNDNITDPSMLVAGHFKRWADSNDEERLDPDNGYLATPNLDKLLNDHWVSIADDGSMLYIDKTILDIYNIDSEMNFGFPTEKQKIYLGAHRDKFFEKKKRYE